jgi:hypothetical protein
MLAALKSLLVVLLVAWVVFALAKPICLRFMTETDFIRRRNIWIVLTAVGLLSPNIWLFALVAIPILIWSGHKETNCVALYLLLMHVVPPVGKQIPIAFINQLFELDFYRILAIALLTPAARKLMGAKTETKPSGLGAMDGLVLAYLALSLVLGMPHESITNTLRRTFLFGIDVLLLYYVVSRTCISRRLILEALAAVVLTSAIAAPLALVEGLSTWLLYQPIGYRWETADSIRMLMREDMLRAQVSVGHSLALGYMISMGFCCWLHLRTHLDSKGLGLGIGVWMWIGLAATLSRGPAMTAVMGYFAYMALGWKGSVRLAKSMITSALLIGVFFASPLGDSLMEFLPFVGTVDAETVNYRQRLAAVSWTLILENPLFGDPFFMSNMEEMRQGQGIIDLVNVYAAVALQSGTVGLLLLLGPFLLGMWKTLKLIKQSSVAEPGLADLGAVLIACMLATLFMFATGSFGTCLVKMYYVLAGLAAGYASLADHAQGQPKTIATAAPRQSSPFHRQTAIGTSRGSFSAHR